jgi:hypothetical protein
MRFQQVGRTAGDETTPYKVTDFKSRTVGEFIQEVLIEKPNEWGYISVGGHFYQPRKSGSCEYRCGRLLSDMPDELLGIEIREIVASGGWSRMDYTINWE